MVKSKKAEDIGTKVARIARELKAKKTLGDRVAKVAAPKAPKAAKPAKEVPAKKLSGLDAAAQVLLASKVSLSAKEIVGQMVDQGLWSSPAGKTPEATIYAAMVTEIKKKGDEARFCKAERGKFIHAAHKPD